MGDERIKRFWTLAHANDRKSPLTCDLFTWGQGLEVRCHAGEVVLHSQRVASMADAMNFCEAWKAGYHGQGWFEPSE